MSGATIAAIDDATGLDIDEVARRGLRAFVEYLTADTRRARVVLLEVVGASAELEDRRHAVLREFAELATTVWLSVTEQTESSAAQRLAAVGLVGAVNHLLVD